MRAALVLFKGTGSIDVALEQAGWHVTSLDILPKFNATFTENTDMGLQTIRTGSL